MILEIITLVSLIVVALTINIAVTWRQRAYQVLEERDRLVYEKEKAEKALKRIIEFSNLDPVFLIASSLQLEKRQEGEDPKHIYMNQEQYNHLDGLRMYTGSLSSMVRLFGMEIRIHEKEHMTVK